MILTYFNIHCIILVTKTLFFRYAVTTMVNFILSDVNLITKTLHCNNIKYQPIILILTVLTVIIIG